MTKFLLFCPRPLKTIIIKIVFTLVSIHLSDIDFSNGEDQL